MLSGDNEKTAKVVAEQVGIPTTNVIAGVLPHEKALKIQWLQQVGTKRPATGLSRAFGRGLNNRAIVAMTGDGINDAAVSFSLFSLRWIVSQTALQALSAADVGIAVGSGSDVALSSASFILVSSNLRGILTLTKLSRKVFNRVKINFVSYTVQAHARVLTVIDRPTDCVYRSSGQPFTTLSRCLLPPG
jgi:cation transport ATPase